MRKAIITVDLGFGDSAKGATVDHLVRITNAGLVVRYCGGHQAGHNVVLPDGRSHTFSQFGAGTLAGAATYLGPNMIIEPFAMERENLHLYEMIGKHRPALTIHPDALVTTPYHRALNRLREVRSAKKHGSCGVGIGETRNYWLKYGQDAIKTADLKEPPILRTKLELMRQRLSIELSDLNFSSWSSITAEEAVETVKSSSSAIAARLTDAFFQCRAFVCPELPDSDMVIFEGAQGVLIDEYVGFHPYTTWSTVTCHHALEIAQESGIDDIQTYGIVRAYMTRHGPGPFPTYDKHLSETIVDQHNPPNPWQGELRAGWLDLPLLKYAAANCGAKLDGLVVNCVDQIMKYRSNGNKIFVNTRYPSWPLDVARGFNLQEQQRIGECLQVTYPGYKEVGSVQDSLEMLTDIAPIVSKSYGPTWKDRSSCYSAGCSDERIQPGGRTCESK